MFNEKYLLLVIIHLYCYLLKIHIINHLFVHVTYKHIYLHRYNNKLILENIFLTE